LNLQDTGFSLVWLVGSWLVMLFVLVPAIRTAPWHKVTKDKEAQHVFLGFSVLQFFVWQFSAQIEGGVNFHFLLIALSVLMFGWQFSLFSAIIAVFSMSLIGTFELELIALNFVLQGVIPVVIVWFLVKWSYRVLDRNFFVFVFFNGFFAAALSTLVALGLIATTLVMSGAMEGEKVKTDFVQYFPMILIPEGFINGILVAAVIILKPSWVSCFSDDAYLKGK